MSSRVLSVREIAESVNAGHRSAEQIALQALERAADYDRVQPAAWISRLSERELREKASRVDERVAAGEQLPLAGVPVAVKDNIDVAGMDTTAACPAFARRADTSAHVVERLLAAGAVIVGKANLDQFATGLVGTRSPYGASSCVFNLEYISGGSSAGSAVLVASGVVPLALGSDTAGSGRVPASFNNLVGLKPTRGRWSSRGLLPACRTLDCITSLTADVTDAALVDAVAADFDALDSYARRPPEVSLRVGAHFRFGVPAAQQLKDLSAQDAALFAAALPRLRAAGGTPVEVDVSPLLEAARLLYGGPWVAERTAVLESLLNTNPAAIHPVVRGIAQAGRGISGVDTFRGFYALQDYARAVEAIWEKADVLVMPTTPTIYRRSEVQAEPVALNAHLGLYTNFVNLLDMAALSLPAGFRNNRTGFGITLIAPAWCDGSLLELGARYEQAGALPSAPALDRGSGLPRVQLAVVGAHLSGMPLNWQLTSRDARLSRTTRTAPLYRLYAMAGQSPPKPALIHAGPGNGSIELEIYELEVSAFGSFVADVPPPLAIGTVELDDGTSVHSFLAEPRALNNAIDITAYGGWRAYMAKR
jgi:allophanate hydrolase